MSAASSRTRTACASCTRRKVRCSKTIPCETCIRRGEQDSCGPDELVPSPVLATPTTMQRDTIPSELAFLRRRIRELERQSCRLPAEGDGLDKHPRQQTQDRYLSPLLDNAVVDDTEDVDNEEGSQYSAADQDRENDGSFVDRPHHPGKRRDTSDTVIKDAASILEFLAWGRRKDPGHHPASTGRHSSVGDGSTTVADMATITVLDEADALHTPFGEFGGRPDHLQQLNMDDNDSADGDNPFSGSHPHSAHNPLAVMQLLLPSRRQVEQLVDYHVECLLWYHASFLAPRFRADLASFYDRFGGHVDAVEAHRGVAGLDLQWVALLFAVLSGSLTCAPTARAAAWGFLGTERPALCKHWFQAALACLARAPYMAHHSVRSCQAIATMTISAHILGFSNTQSIQLAAAVRIDQSLGLHRLGSRSHDGSPGTADVEEGRRVWSQLCSQDWFGIPFSESYLVNPLHAQTARPANVHDEDLAAAAAPSDAGSSSIPVQPEAEPTVSGYCRFLNTIASIMPRLQDGLLSCNTAYTRYQQVLSWDAHMRALATAGRPRFLGPQVPLQDHWPCWVPWARRALAISSGHKIIMIHRSFLSESFTNPAFAFTRHTCIAASKTIIKEYKAVVREEGPVLWVHQAFSVAASIILTLDVLHRGPGDDASVVREHAEHARLVEDVVDLLRQFPQSMIAVRGMRLLRALLDEVGRRDAAPAPDERFAIGEARSRKRKRPWTHDHRSSLSVTSNNGFNVPAFIRSYCRGETTDEQRQPSSRPHYKRRRQMPSKPLANGHSVDTEAVTSQPLTGTLPLGKDHLLDSAIADTVDTADRFPVASVGEEATMLSDEFVDTGTLGLPTLLPPGWERTSNGFENLLYLASHDMSLP
ncbi:c6 zinc finger domain containing protein [Sporothrix brasiliensis 5110]|uniref:C6 zinc finger domain containing protein n=1 Tax=Sporothrix brasiliensis 5110 TaxID=1398154 RepID=A0A0C2IHS0_9PEZI|nr:c6 zinc finger domain containing protein [Sporothrix brasiliensis 5110]KIH88706.1 c6 zinc finger domain containing protein [Sporothrix brasiliensis 5110]